MSLEFSDMYSTLFLNNTKIHAFIPSTKKFVKEKAINELRKLINTKTRNLSVPLLSDEFLLRFLYARKMNVENAFQLIISYFSFRKNNPNLFEDLSVSDDLVQNCLHDGLPLVLKDKDRKGRRVLLFLIYQWEHTKYTIETIYRSLLMSMEYLLNDSQCQVNGFIFIVDWTNFKFRDYIDISPKMLKLMIDGFQDSFPAKIKGIHFIGQPWYVDGVLTVVKQFLKEKTRQKLIVHGTNLSSLHEYLPLDVVTPELGGEGNAYKPDEWIDILKTYEQKEEATLARASKKIIKFLEERKAVRKGVESSSLMDGRKLDLECSGCKSSTRSRKMCCGEFMNEMENHEKVLEPVLISFIAQRVISNESRF